MTIPYGSKSLHPSQNKRQLNPRLSDHLIALDRYLSMSGLLPLPRVFSFVRITRERRLVRPPTFIYRTTGRSDSRVV